MVLMTYTFYQRGEDACPKVKCCPHLGGAAVASVVLLANENANGRRHLLGTIDAERERNAKLFAENQRLLSELEQVKLELKLERQNKFATPQRPRVQEGDEFAAAESEKRQPKKRGAPVGHPGWFRPLPKAFDWDVDVPAPRRCPHCHAKVTRIDSVEPAEHLQEDILDGQYRVVLYRHPVARCDECGKRVEQAGDGELLDSRMGPHLRSAAVYLRNVIGISYRKVPRAIGELFGITFTAAALLGFETLLAEKAIPVVDDIAKKLGSSDGAVHADETYWTLDGKRAYYWVHGDEQFIHFQFDTSRSGQVSRDVLGEHFTGTLVTDCYSGYAAHVAGAKQKCLAHLARTAREWQKLTKDDSLDFTFFEEIKEFVRRGCRFHRHRKVRKSSGEEQVADQSWLRDELRRLASSEVTDEKAITLQARILRHYSEWLVFLDDPRVPPTNNLAERALRPLVVLRKITFGHRSAASAKRMAKIMTIAETARRHGHRASDLFLGLYLRPPDRVMRRLYAAV